MVGPRIGWRSCASSSVKLVMKPVIVRIFGAGRRAVIMLFSIVFATILPPSAIGQARAQENSHSYQREDVLGTSMTFTVVGEQRAHADAALSAALDEIERLSKIVNTYDTGSEISRLNRTQSAVVSEDLFSVLQSCEYWRVKSDNGFSCRLGEITAAWQEAQDTSVAPARPALRLLAGKIRRTEITLEPETREVARVDPVLFDTNGLAKGYIIDKAIGAARGAAPKARGLMLDIGGDIRIWGDPPEGDTWRIGVDDPMADADNAPPLTVLSLAGGAVATSGRGKREFTVGEKSYPHILSPQDGWPMEETAAATVFANEAEVADALATAFSVMKVQAALALTDSLADVEVLLATKDGRQFVSDGWRAIADRPPFAAKDDGTMRTSWPEEYRLVINYEVPEIDAPKYRAPYLAIWITDEKKAIVSAIAMLGEIARWQEENYVWQRRYGRKNPALVDAMSEPSRKPGEYRFVWDGVDDFGERRAQGDYVLNIESAREFGDHKLVQVPLSLGDTSFTISQVADGEVGEIGIEYGLAE